ncbi:MAG: GTP-dependent dephospho-CoA kinase family protein [Candidatus Bathyarchaeota archaeon]|nr:GTP-dependent dephospho-CoA kinase family protein [Candidatus Bathyarchaeota archaeon]
MSERQSVPQVFQERLKKPWGLLIRGTFTETIGKIREIIEKENPPCIITVGDAVSKNLVENGIYPKLVIIDNKIMRAKITSTFTLPTGDEIRVKNPPGTLTQEALNAVEDAFKTKNRVKIIIDGEEDLLTLAAVLYSPENSIVIYGQPNEGAVVVKVTRDKKGEAVEILKTLRDASKN